MSSLTHDLTRRKLLYRATHRGTREMDLMLGPYAQHRLPTMNETELNTFETLLDISDDALFAYVIHDKMDPQLRRHPLAEDFKQFVRRA